MNYVTYCNGLMRLQKKFIDFLPYCENEKQTFKLLDEIQHLKFKICKINRMTMLEAAEEVQFQVVFFKTL